MSPSSRSQKETEMIKSWNPLKSCRAPLNGIEKKKKHYPLGIVHSREFHNSKEIDRRITQDMHLQIPSPKTMKSLSLNHRRKKDLPSLIQATRIELLHLKQTIFVLTSKPLVSLSCSDEFSSHDIVLHTK